MCVGGGGGGGRGEWGGVNTRCLDPAYLQAKFRVNCTSKETICMKCQILFSRKKNKKNISECRLLKFFTQYAKC